MRERFLPVALIGLGAAALPAVLEILIGKRGVSLDGQIHFYSVGFTALAAAAAAIALTYAGARVGDTRTVLVGTAFAVMAALLALHGLSTPGVIFGRNGVVSFTGGTTLPVGGAILALSTFTLPRFLRGVKPLLILQAVLLTTVIGLGISGIIFPSLVPPVPATNSPSAMGVLIFGLFVFSLLALRTSRTYMLTRRIADLVVLIGIVWLATALVPALTMSYDELGWWMGHMIELDGILLVGIPVALDLAQTVQSRPLAGDLHAAELVTAEDVFLGSHVAALTVRLAQRDEYTEQHTRRVALRAVQVGVALGLSASRLRSLAIGGLVHDIGKLSVPDSILKKPAALDDDEYSVIRKHPEWGTKLLDELGGFSESVRRLVQDHHERLDGNGYPRGLPAAELDLDTRILTVCDVYDALISPRVYRPAWSHEQAMSLLRAETGTAFDERCVTALESVLRGEPGDLTVPDFPPPLTEALSPSRATLRTAKS
ncbi:MAG TPA: HD-GYP domain-containing protein [Gaiellaceae bacterium]|nr:HD-GYP domain-containing protein [Gaiellaceae bacterium]